MGLSESGFAHRANWKVMGWEKAACLVLGDSPLQALGFTVNLVHLWPIQGCLPQRESQSRRVRGGHRGLCGVLCLDLCSALSPPTDPRPTSRESQRPSFPRDSCVSNTVCQHT